MLETRYVLWGIDRELSVPDPTRSGRKKNTRLADRLECGYLTSRSIARSTKNVDHPLPGSSYSTFDRPSCLILARRTEPRAVAFSALLTSPARRAASAQDLAPTFEPDADVTFVSLTELFHSGDALGVDKQA